MFGLKINLKDLNKIRKTSAYRFLAYATYVWFGLAYINYRLFAGTREALLGLFIMFFLYFVGFLAIGAGFCLWYVVEIKTSSSKTEELPNKTNILHDIGVIIYFLTILIVAGAFALEG